MVDLMVPMAPIQKIQSMIMCGVLPRTFVPSMTSMDCLTVQLQVLQYLANQRH